MHERMDLQEAGFLPPLVKRYLDHDPHLLALTGSFPDQEGFDRALTNRRSGHISRDVLADALLEQYRCVKNAAKVRNSIESLRSPEVFTVTTGHQLCLASGPLYFLYKIIHTIKLARHLSDSGRGIQVVPVFWIATEDHDLEEIDHFRLFNRSLRWNTDQKGAVGRMNTAGIEKLIKEAEVILPRNESAKNWLNVLRKAYEEPTLARATRELVHKLFGDSGVVVIDGDDPKLKALFKPVVLTELNEPLIRDAVLSAESQIEALGGKAQAHAREINLFYLESGSRERIEREADGFVLTNSTRKWNKAELLNELDQAPERFSPNVILRPVYQELILPNLCYIGGAGEISYWFQLKGVFDLLKLPFPVLMPRNSALVVDAKSRERMNKFSLSFADLFLSSDELTKKWLDAIVDFDVVKEEQQIDELFRSLANRAAEIDPTLEKAVLAEGQRQTKAIKDIEKRVLKAAKQREEVDIRQLHSLKDKLFPGGTLQERTVNFGELFSTGASDLIEVLLKEMQAEVPGVHLIELP